MTTENITWEDIHQFVNQIEDYYSDKEYPSGVYGIPRGGLVIATMLSHKLAIPLLMAPYDGCLIVDDIADSGESLIHYHKMGYDIATVVCGPNSKVKPKLCYKQREADWIVYPWESNTVADIDKDAKNYFTKRRDNTL